MNTKLKTSLHNNDNKKKFGLNKAISCFKKENWKTSESSKKKLKQYKNDPSKILERFRKVHRKKYDYSKVNYVSLTKAVIILCKKHGEFQITPKSHLGRDSKNILIKKPPLGCPKCIIDDVILDFQKIHGKKYDYSKIELKYKSFLITIICPKHGEFKQTLTRHLNGSNCPLCSSI